MSQTWPDLLTGLVTGHDLEPADTAWAMNEILAGAASPAQIAGFMVALQAKGVTPGELTGLVRGMLENARPITLPSHEAVDIVGTGGDRAASSACGTADCLEALGVVLDLDPALQARVFDEAGIVFLFAAHYHPSLRHAAVARRELGIRTVFNFLGPLANPAKPAAQAIGVADPVMAATVADVVAGRGHRGLVFHGGDGLDELTTTTGSRVWIIADGRTVETTLDPAELGLARAQREDLVGGDPAFNSRVARDTFAGAPGAVRDIVALNAAAALLAFDGPDPDAPLAAQMAPRLERATRALDDGSAAHVLQRWVDVTHRIG